MMLIEGDSTTVQRAVEAAERTITGAKVTVRANFATPQPPAVALAEPSRSDESSDVDAHEHADSQTDGTQKDVGTSLDEGRPVFPRRPRTFKVPEVLDELRAHEEPDSFKAFVGGRSVEKDLDRAIVVAVWLKQKRDVVAFDTRHLHTCFEMMAGWKLPDDPGQVLRNMKQRGFVRSVAGKQFELTTTGANRYQELS